MGHTIQRTKLRGMLCVGLSVICQSNIQLMVMRHLKCHGKVFDASPV